MLLFVCAALMTTVCIIEWPKSPEEIAESIIKKIEERQAANTNSNRISDATETAESVGCSRQYRR
jgi:hypothetical protein